MSWGGGTLYFWAFSDENCRWLVRRERSGWLVFGLLPLFDYLKQSIGVSRGIHRLRRLRNAG
jgi:hypothetical protein